MGGIFSFLKKLIFSPPPPQWACICKEYILGVVLHNVDSGAILPGFESQFSF